MKKYTLLVSFFVMCLYISAQSPNSISYQAVLRNSSNALLSSQAVSIKVDILKNSLTGAIIYSEEHAVVTNSNGLATLAIGDGSVLSGDFSDIEWGVDSFFIQTSIDLEGGSDYTLIGTSLCQSVPYSFYATSADTIIGNISVEQISGFSDDGVINALDYGVKGDGMTDDSNAIKALLEQANGQRVFFPAASYKVDSLESAAELINIDGVCPMYVDGALQGGTIFRGGVSFTGKNVRISNIGVDLSGLDAGDGLRVTPPKVSNNNVGEFCSIHNLITVGADKTTPYHSFLIEGFDQVNISNIEVRDAYMGVILKVEGGFVNNIRAFEIDRESLFIKSDNFFGYCMDLIIDNVYVENSSAPLSTGIKLLSSGAQMENVSLSNIFVRRTQIGISIISAGSNGVKVNNVNVSNVKIDYPSLFGIYFEANKGSVEHVNMSNIDVTHTTNVLTTVGDVRYLNISGVNASTLSTTVANKEQILNIGEGTVGTNLSNVIVLNQNSPDPDLAILYANDGNENRISNYNLRLRGGVPQSSQDTVSIFTGAVNVLQPDYNNINNLSIVTVKPDGVDATIDSLSVYPNEAYTSDLFSLGYELLIQNASDYEVHIKHNPNGNIFNPSQADVTVLAHAFAKYIFNGSVWVKE